MKVQEAVNKFCGATLQVCVSAALGYTWCRFVLTSINPVAGAIFSATATATSIVTQPIFDKIFHGKNASGATKFVGNVLQLGTSIGAGIAVTKAAGFGFSAQAGVGLTLSAAAVPLIIFGAAVTTALIATAIFACVSAAKAR